MVINGNMPPVPNTLEFAKGQGMALTQAFGHLDAQLCFAFVVFGVWASQAQGSFRRYLFVGLLVNPTLQAGGVLSAD